VGGVVRPVGGDAPVVLVPPDELRRAVAAGRVGVARVGGGRVGQLRRPLLRASAVVANHVRVVAAGAIGRQAAEVVHVAAVLRVGAAHPVAGHDDDAAVAVGGQVLKVMPLERERRAGQLVAAIELADVHGAGGAGAVLGVAGHPGEARAAARL